MTMRKIFIIHLIMILLFTAVALAQQDDKAGETGAITLQQLPSSLEEMLGRALKSNPDIEVAEADLHHAQTGLNQVRLHVSQVLVEAFQERRARQEALKIAREKYDRMKERVDAGLVHQDQLQDPRREVTIKEAGVAEIESSIRRHVGIDPAKGETPDSLEKALVQAFQTNGDVALARADLARADAKLNQVRLKVTEEVTITFQNRRSCRFAFDYAEKNMQSVQEKKDKGLLSERDRLGAFQNVIEAESALTKTDARLRYLLGLGGVPQRSR